MQLAPLLFVASAASADSPCSQMPEDQVQRLSSSASNGDSEAAIQLFEHFVTSCTNNLDDTAFWLRLAAEQRNCRGMIEWGRMLRGTGRDVEKGEWWLRQAASAGCEAVSAGANYSLKRTNQSLRD